MARSFTLQKKLTLFLLLPVAVLLCIMGVLGYTLGRQTLLDQWSDAAVLRLQRAAGEVDARLAEPKALIRLFHHLGASGGPDGLDRAILQALRDTEGVAGVELDWTEAAPEPPSSRRRGMQGGMSEMGPRWMSMSPRRSRIREVGIPRYDPMIRDRTVTLVSDLMDEDGRTLGILRVVLRFEHLIDAVAQSGWWQSRQAFLVARSGTVLAGTEGAELEALGDGDNPLEAEVLGALARSGTGTLLGRRHSQFEVAGFAVLEEAPWSLVIFAPADEILAPVFRFELYYGVTGLLCILTILLLIRLHVKRTVAAVGEVSRAAKEIADGRLGAPLPVKSTDEVGELTHSFNTMIGQLKERARMKEALDLARETQQLLIPHRFPSIPGLDIAGTTRYCDETGGDYYDLFPVGSGDRSSWGVSVGDVSGHGIPAALLMASVRSALRQRSLAGEDPAAIVADVNRQVAGDVEDSGQFVTLFLLTVDPSRGRIRWVRAGHDPALYYDPSADRFEDLGGRGVAMGLDESARFSAGERNGFPEGHVLVLGTDGIWESMNPDGEMFGRERLRASVRRHAGKSAGRIAEAVIRDLDGFCRGRSMEDDVTLVVVKST